MLRPLFGSLIAGLAPFVVLACRQPPPPPPPPPAEFLLSAGDSTFWLEGDTAGVRLRGAPLVIGTWNGRYYEIFVTDDDRSFEEAAFLGQRIFARDLMTGDSLQVFADTAAPRAARRYAMANPSAKPLGPDENGMDDPPTSVLAEVDVLDLYGPYLSFEYHLDVRTPDADEWHSTRRGVIDLRTGKVASLADLFGDGEATRLASAGRIAYRATLDSVRLATDDRGRRAAESLASFRFDPTSFSLADFAGEPIVQFVAPGRGEGPSGFTLPIPELVARPAPWWSEVQATLPMAMNDAATVVVWRRPRYRVIARYDSTGEAARVVLADSTGTEWAAGTVLGPVRNIFWLDQPAPDSSTRHALERAFDEAMQYERRPRAADARPGASRLTFAARTAPSPGVRAAHRRSRAPTLRTDRAHHRP